MIARESLYRAACYLAFASAVAILVSITASQTLLGLSIAALLVSGARLRIPRIWLPLTLFLAGTLISLAFSPEPMHGLPQVKKMFVFSMLIAIFSTVREPAAARRLVLWWSGIGALASCVAIVQFAIKWRQARLLNLDFYKFYVDKRITGFMSHWMTFAGQEMVVLLMLLSLLFFAPGLRRWQYWILGCCAVLLSAAELLSETRTVWLGLGVAGLWLVWWWKRWMAPAGLTVLLAIALVPGPVHDRFVSVFRPQQSVDSNEFRRIAFRSGLRMIAAHPLFGIGLDETKYHFLDYLPPETPKPLPPGFYQHLHNFYLQYAAERGIPTMLMMLWMLMMILRDFFRGLQRLAPGPSDERFLLHGGIATVIGIMLSGLFEVNLGDSEVLTVFLVVVACGYVAVQEQI